MKTFFLALVLYVSLKTLLLFRSPSTLSLDEIKLLSQLNIWLPLGLPIQKLLTGVVGVVTLFALWFFLRRNNCSKYMLMGALLTLCTAPFFLLTTNFLGPSVYILVGCALVLALPNRIWSVIALAAILLITAMQFGLRSIPLAELSTIADIDLWFFDAKSLPLFLTIPASGLSVFFTIVPFGIGLYDLLGGSLMKRIKKGALFVGYTLFVILFLYIPIYVKLVPLLIVVSLISGHGYHYLISSFRGRFRQTIVLLVLMIFSLLGVAYSTEILINHFDKKTSFEWGAAEMQTLVWLQKNSFQYYVTPESDKLVRYYEYFSRGSLRRIRLTKTEFSQLALICSKRGNACILRGHEMEKLGLSKTQADFTGRFEDGLEAYYVIIQ